MGNERYAVPVGHSGRGGSHRLIKVAIIEDHLAAAFEHSLVVTPETLAVVSGIGAVFPLDLKCGASLHRRPGRRCHNGNTAGENEVRLSRRGSVDAKNIEHAVNGARRFVIEGANGRVEYGRTRNHRVAHIGLLRIDAVLRPARNDIECIDRVSVGADDAIVTHGFQWRRFFRQGQRRGGYNEFAVGNLGAARLADDEARPRRTVRSVDAKP